MNPREQTSACDALTSELWRVMYDETAEPSGALRAHLARCTPCRYDLAEARRLTAVLEAALAAAPLERAAEERIRRQVLARRAAGSGPRAGGQVRWGLAAVAAGVLAALLLPQTPPVSTKVPPAAVVLTPDDARVIAEAYALLALDEPMEYSTTYLAAQVEDMLDALDERGTGQLPWGPDEDWDVPVGEVDTSVPGAAPRTWAGLLRLDAGPHVLCNTADWHGLRMM